LDKDVLRASILSAEKKSQKYQLPAWSVDLAKARTKVVELKKCLSMMRTGLDNKPAIALHLNKGTFTDELFPTNKQRCIQELRSARKEDQKIVNDSFARQEEEQKARSAQSFSY
jgi:hypothetical protein